MVLNSNTLQIRPSFYIFYVLKGFSNTKTRRHTYKTIEGNNIRSLCQPYSSERRLSPDSSFTECSVIFFSGGGLFVLALFGNLILINL